MSETNALGPREQTPSVPPADAAAAQMPEAAGHPLRELLGVGGMGEVYRCGDEALQRDLALKVLRPELAGDADAEQRFLREARLTGSLQHPGVVPVHQLGRLADGRPCYTMKLVRGRTLAELLRDEPAGPERLPRLLAVIEKVCQAVAFAHSKGVIHRDLKPGNVMVGEFGEVQVMDWGLAKELSCGEPAAPPEETETVETVARQEEGAGLSRAGRALGTPAYMPPEQAAGDWDIVDERADVFALGAMLCEVLTGKPPYHGSNRDDLLRRARRGDVAEALGRLEKCGADAALVGLCRECLAAERLERPRQAGVVAERLAAYQAEVRERLRQAELERARAEVQAREAAKRRRLLAALALAGLLLLVAGVAAWGQWQRRQAEADGAVRAALGEAGLLRDQARADPLSAVAYEKAVSAARKAEEIARGGGASEGMQGEAAALLAELQQEAEEAARDRRLLARLLEARGPREGPKYSRDDKGTMMALAQPTAEELFVAAFREWGLDVDAAPTAEAAARLKARPAVVVTEVIAALDEWAGQRRQDQKPEAAVRRLAELAAALDDDPGSLRRELRAIVGRDRLSVERALGVLSAALRPVPLPVEVPWGADRARLRQLAERTEPAREPVLGLLTLARALRVAGEEALAERLLRKALTARPREVVLYHALGDLLATQAPPRWGEAVTFYLAARGLRPDLGVKLAEALRRSGREEEGLDLLAVLVKESPDNPYLHRQQAYALYRRHDLDSTIACCKKALELDPKHAEVHANLGVALHDKGDLDGAIACYKKAVELDPKDAKVHTNLGGALRDKGDRDGAIACCKKAVELDPKHAPAHAKLGAALYDKHDLDGAIACYKKALELDPKHAEVHTNLGVALHDKGDRDGAIACYERALELDPTLAEPHCNLGNALRDKGDVDGAIACYKKALELDPKAALAHNNLGNALRDKGDVDGAIACYKRALELDPKHGRAHYNLGIALGDKGRLDEAVDEYRQAIHFEPDYAEAHCNLAGVLQQQGRFEESLAYLQRGHALGSKQPGWRYPSAQWVHEAETLLALDQKLPAILSGQQSPANAKETIALASLCQQPFKKRFASSARLYAEAFTAEPKLAADLGRQHRYQAAGSAALAAAGQGEDARLLPDKVVGMFRHWALGWLRDDLTAYTQLAQQNNPALKQAIRQRLAHWRADADLASVRDPKALDALAEDERAAWQALWRDVDELAARLKKAEGNAVPERREPAAGGPPLR